MKKIQSIVAASALVLIASQASAAVYNVSVSSSGSLANAVIGGAVNGSGAGLLDTGTGILDFSIAQTTTIGIGSTSGYAAGTVSTDNAWDVFTVANSEATVTSCVDSQNTLVCAGFTVGNTANSSVISSTYAAPIGTGDDFDMSTFSESVNATVGLIGTSITYTFAVGSEVSEVPVPAAAWLFGSAIVGLAGIGRKRKVA